MKKKRFYFLVLALASLSFVALAGLPGLAVSMKYQVDDARTRIEMIDHNPEQKSAAYKDIDRIEHKLNVTAVALLAFSAFGFISASVLYIKRPKIITS